jgi:hypothetical protein
LLPEGRVKSKASSLLTTLLRMLVVSIVKAQVATEKEWPLDVCGTLLTPPHPPWDSKSLTPRVLPVQRRHGGCRKPSSRPSERSSWRTSRVRGGPLFPTSRLPLD